MRSQFKIQKLLPFTSHPKLSAIIANVGWLFCDRILRMGMSLIVGVWVARYLGVQQYGLFNYAGAFVALFSPLASLGLDNIIVRELVGKSEDKDKILGTTFGLKILGSLISFVLAIVAIICFRHDDPQTIWITAILAASGIFQVFDTIDFWFQSQVQSKYTVIAKNIAFIIIALIKIALIQMQAPLIAFAWTTLGELCLGGIGLAIAYKVKGFSIWLWRWSLPLARSLLKESWSLILSGFAIMVYMTTDQIMLGQMVGDQAVGFYAAATRISEMWYFIPMAIASSVSPSIYEAKENNEPLYYQRLKQLMRLMVILSIVIAIPMTFMSGTIINLLFGDGYVESKSVLSIHIWASVFIFMGVAISPWFIAEKLTHLSFQRTLIGGITNVVLNLFLIPVYSGVGAAIATVISQAFASFFSNVLSKKTRKIFWLQVQSLLFFKK